MEVSVPEIVGDGLGDSLVESRVVGARVGETVGKLDGAVEGTRLGAPYINKWRFKSQYTVHTYTNQNQYLETTRVLTLIVAGGDGPLRNTHLAITTPFEQA